MNKMYKRYAESRPHENQSEIQRYYLFGEDKEPIEHYKNNREEQHPFISNEEFQELCAQAERAISKKLDDIFKDLK